MTRELIAMLYDALPPLPCRASGFHCSLQMIDAPRDKHKKSVAVAKQRGSSTRASRLIDLAGEI